MGELFPVIVVVYDATRDRAYWLHVQEEFGSWLFSIAHPAALLYPRGRG
jgi:hypothetical protein